MAKSSKKSKEATAEKSNPATPGLESSDGLDTAEAVKSPAAKKAAGKSAGRAKSSGKSRGATRRRAASPGEPRAKPAQASPASGEAAVTDEEIRMRAYFIAEWRMQNGIAGDSAHDWLEARRQLQEEAGKRS